MMQTPYFAFLFPMQTLISNETAFEGYLNQESDQRSGSWHGDGSAVSASINQSSPDFSIKFGNSIFINGDSAIDSSKLWKVHAAGI